MTFRSAPLLRSGARSFFSPIGSKLNAVSSKIRNLETPERLKGTFLERWGKYWKNLYLDYEDTVRNVVKECKERPVRASIYFSILGMSYYCASHNPDETSFREKFLQDTERLMQVGQSTRNPIAEEHVKWLGRCYDEGIVRRLNLGIMSVIWLDNYDATLSMYKAVCPYLKPRYLTFYERVVDVGFLENWWILDSKMKDYDINDAEFTDTNIPITTPNIM